TDQDVLLCPGQQTWGRVATLSSLPTEQAERVGVERSGERLAGRRAQSSGDLLSYVGSGTPAERQYEHLLRVEAVVQNPVDDGFDDRRRLSRPRPRENQRRATAVLDHLPLCLIKCRRPSSRSRLRRRRRAHEPYIHRPHIHRPHISGRHVHGSTRRGTHAMSQSSWGDTTTTRGSASGHWANRLWLNVGGHVGGHVGGSFLGDQVFLAVES